MSERPVALREDAPALLSALRTVRRVAAPSWVVPAALADNCRFLAGKVDEAGLLFFDADASLAYGKEDLPPDLARLPLTYHVHLPLDLPWHDPGRAAAICHSLLERCAFLARGEAPLPCAAPSSRLIQHSANAAADLAAGPEPGIRAVLHPPACPGRGGCVNDARDGKKRLAVFLDRFAALGGAPSLLLVENVPENDLSELEDVISAADLGFCLDLGHLLACGQERLLSRKRVIERTRMLHLSAPGTGGGRIRHVTLTALSRRGLETGRRLCLDTPDNAVLMVELFSWSLIEESLPVLCSWLLPEG